jgi:capsular polysaccharide biosynthesis protein
MSMKKILEIIGKNAKGLFLAGLLLGTLSFFLLVVTQKSSRATTDLLVVQNSGNATDYYAMSKSIDYLNGILLESVYSEKFLEEMKNIDNATVSFLPVDKADRLTAWQKTVILKKNTNAGIITAQVFGDNAKQTTKISNVLIDVLTNKYALFLGQGQNIEVKVLSGPIVEKNPTVTQIILVSLGGFVIGILLFGFWVFYQEEARKNSAVRSFGKNTAIINNQSREEEILYKSQSEQIEFFGS